MVAQPNPTSQITLTTVIDEDRKLIIDLPPDTPMGEVEVQVTVRSTADVNEEAALKDWHTEYKRLRAKLVEAGSLSTIWAAPEDAHELNEQELWQLGQMPPDAPPSEVLIREDRGQY